MVTFVTLLQIVYDELKGVVQNNTTVSTPDDHVGVMDRSLDQATPYFGFDYDQNAINRGMGGNVRNRAVNTDSNGDVTSVEKVRDYELLLDIGVVVDGDEPRQRDEYISAVQDHWMDIVDDASKLHDDVHRVRDEGVIPQAVQGGDVGAMHTYAIEFVSGKDISVPTADNIDWDVDVSGTDAYPENY